MTVTDADLNTDPATAEEYTLFESNAVLTLRRGATLNYPVSIYETGVDTGVFSGSLQRWQPATLAARLHNRL